MEIQYRAFGGRVIAKVEGDTIAKLFENIAQLAEVFDADSNCGMCGSANIRPNFRKAKGFSFYELKCNCGARLAFGQHKEGGGLWAKREDDAGNPMDHNGWSKYLAIAPPAEEQRQAPQSSGRSEPNNNARQPPPPRAPVSQPDNEKLKFLLAQADPDETIRELYDNLLAIYDEEGGGAHPKTSAVWNKAAPKNATPQQIIRALYWKIQEEVPTAQ